MSQLAGGETGEGGLIPRMASRGHTRREGSLGPDGGSAHCWAWLPIRAVAVDADRAIARQQPRVPATPLMVPVETEPEACSDLNEGPMCQLPSQRVLRAPPVASAPSTTVSAWPPAGLLPSEQALPLEAVMTAPQPSGRLATPKGVAPGAAWPARPAWIAGRQAVSKFENQYLLPHVCGFSGI